MKYRPPRVPTRIPCTLNWQGTFHRCTVTSINEGGAALSVDQPIEVGDQIVLEGRNGPIRATVRWADGGVVGIAFAKILSQRDKDQFCLSGHNRPTKLQFGMQFNELR